MTGAMSRDVVERLASALDADDFGAAAAMLASNCTYETSSKTFVGSEAIIESFREATTWAHEHLDRVTYQHTLVHNAEGSGTIRFIDIFKHCGEQCVHECLMHVSTTPSGLVAGLKLEDLPGERDRVAAFFKRFGLVR